MGEGRRAKSQEQRAKGERLRAKGEEGRAQGEKSKTILADYPDLEPDDLRAYLAYAHAAISHDKLDSLQISV